MIKWLPRRSTDFVVVHASMTPPDLTSTGASHLDRSHRAIGYLRSGYHYIIERDGSVARGRPEAAPGAHCYAYNDRSIAVCLVGGVAEGPTRRTRRRRTATQVINNFTPEQHTSLRELLTNTSERYPDAIICGHRDLLPDWQGRRKSDECPGFDVAECFKKGSD